MAKVLPQQKLLLELLTVSGDIAVPGPRDESLLWRTLDECKKERWLILTEISPGLVKVSITGRGNKANQGAAASSTPGKD